MSSAPRFAPIFGPRAGTGMLPERRQLMPFTSFPLIYCVTSQQMTSPAKDSSPTSCLTCEIGIRRTWAISASSPWPLDFRNCSIDALISFYPYIVVIIKLLRSYYRQEGEALRSVVFPRHIPRSFRPVSRAVNSNLPTHGTPRNRFGRRWRTEV